MDLYKGDKGVGYESGGLEVTGKAREYIQQKNNSIRNYLGGLQADYASRMSMPSENGSMHSGAGERTRDMYKPEQKPKPMLEREEKDIYLRDVA